LSNWPAERRPIGQPRSAEWNGDYASVDASHGIPPYPETRDYVTKVLGLFGPPASAASVPRDFYRTEAPDGTVVYTNVPPQPPPRGRL